VQLTELLYQKVKDLGEQGQLSLKPGYVAVVSKAPSLRVALLAPICPAPDDQRRLTDGAGPTRVGVGIMGTDGTPYRILRELGGNRSLQKFDNDGKKFDTLSEDQLEIDSFLRVECGMPPLDAYAGFFVLEVNELPSLRGKSAAAASDAYVDHPRVKALKDELEQTRKFEGMQDRLFKVQQRLHDLGILSEKLKEAEADVAAVEAELGRAQWTPEEMKDIARRATTAKEALKKRDADIADVQKRRQRALQAVPPPPEPFLSNPWFYGGILAGLAIDGIAFWLKKPFIAFFALIPFLAALIAVLRFIEADEADKEAAAMVKETKDREDSIKRNYDAEQAPLKNALKAAKADSPAELLELFKQRELVLQRREIARQKLDKIKLEPELSRLPIEMPLLTTEKGKLEELVMTMGFSRPVGEIEGDLKHAMGISALASKGNVAIPEQEVPKNLIDRAAELMNMPSEEMWSQMGPRFTAYLTALTDKRVVSAKPDEKGLLTLTAPDGRAGPYASLPPPLRDLVYAALRLTLIERVAGYKRLPVVIDDAFGTFDAAKRGLIAKMLKGISTQTQVIHRVAEAPPPGTADLVLQA
jgi:hypothetical protein